MNTVTPGCLGLGHSTHLDYGYMNVTITDRFEKKVQTHFSAFVSPFPRDVGEASRQRCGVGRRTGPVGVGRRNPGPMHGYVGRVGCAVQSCFKWPHVYKT